MVSLNIVCIKGRECTHLAVFVASTTAAMSLSTLTVTDKLRQAYNGVLLQISFKLDKNHQRKLRHYCNGLIPTHVTDTMDILRSLQHERKISWADISLLKEAMHEIRRFDVVKDLNEFEIKRDLTLLLDFYARTIQKLDLCCSSVSVKMVAGHLVRLMEIVRDKVDITSISLTVESSKDIRKALVDFEQVIDCRELRFTWNEFTMLVIIAGEIIAAVSLNEQRRDPVIELCYTAADELCSRMTELGSWVSKLHVTINLILLCCKSLCLCIFTLVCRAEMKLS